MSPFGKDAEAPATVRAPHTTPFTTTPITAAAGGPTPAEIPVATPVPMLDVNRGNAVLRERILAAVTEVCDSGAFVKGPAVGRLEGRLAEYCGAKHAVACASGTDAILLPLLALGIGPGDEVIVPSFTFFATAGCVWRVGATPVFADIDPATFNIDPADVERKITRRTRAIIPVHLFGQAADMTAITAVAQSRGVPIIEDAAQAIGASHRGRRVGSMGVASAFSFYPTKNLGGFGDGGVITTDDDKLTERMRVLCDHGQSPRYHHALVGLNSRLDTIQAAVLDVKLDALDGYAAARTRHAQRYERELSVGAASDLVETPQEADGCPSVWNQYTVRVSGGDRDELQRALAERKVGSAVYYPIPLHLQKCFADLGYRRGDLPHSERAAEEVLSLPVYPELTADEQGAVIDAVQRFAAATVATRRPLAA
ncbi:MAG: DegT/DnrJ/EryC1/StrS family aminotransferase [Lacipirellulaceae bacterium]